MKRLKDGLILYLLFQAAKRSKVLKLKTTRANYVAFRWRRSCEKTFSISDPHHHGWEIGEDGRYKIKWFDGAMAPSSLEEITVLSEDEEDDFEDIEDSQMMMMIKSSWHCHNVI